MCYVIGNTLTFLSTLYKTVVSMYTTYSESQ